MHGMHEMKRMNGMNDTICIYHLEEMTRGVFPGWRLRGSTVGHVSGRCEQC